MRENKLLIKKNIQSYNIVETKIPNMPTIQAIIGDKRYFLYSKYDPIRDSRVFAEEEYDKNIDCYLVYGLGFGYHIRQLENLIKRNEREYHIYVIECNLTIYKLAMESVDLDQIINNRNITLVLMENNKSSYDKLNRILTSNNMKISIHIPSLNIIPEDFKELKYLLEEFQIKQNTIATISNSLDENFKENINNFDENIDVLFSKFKNRPLYLISAGPSLDKNIHELIKVKESGIILSVGRAVRPLLAANIIPNYIIITDPSDYLYVMQLEGLDINVPIIILSTCDKNIMLNYKGSKYIALQQGYLPAEEYANRNEHSMVKTGGSVATTALDVAIRMGCNPIIFVGQDLAFTNNKTHSKDTFSENIIESKSLRDVEDIYGNIIQTSKVLYIYLRWIQNRIAEEKDIKFIDATEGGARIKGTKVMRLKDVINVI